MKRNRLTYKSSMGDYGYLDMHDFNDSKIKNHIGKLEDDIEELESLITPKEPVCTDCDEFLCPNCLGVVDESRDSIMCSSCIQVLDWRGI